MNYRVDIIWRDGGGQTSDDYHATVTRLSDGVRLVWMSNWLWLLKWKVRRAAVDRAFRYYDKNQKKLEKVSSFNV